MWINDDILGMTAARARAEQAQVLARLANIAGGDGELTPEESAEFDAAEVRARELGRYLVERGALEAVRNGRPGGNVRSEAGAFGGRGNPAGGRPRDRAADLVLRSGESVAQWGTRTGRLPGAADDGGLNFGALVRALVLGDWTDAEAERAVLAESPSAAGGILVPTPMTAGLIDLARSESKVAAMGATVVPMTSQTQKLPRLLTAPVPAWRSENQLIAESGATFDAVTLTAQSLACYVRLSWELVEDASIAADTVRAEFAKAFAATFDYTALRGSGTAPEPRGLRNQAGVTVTAFTPPNGAAFTNYDPLLDAAGVVTAQNWTPSGILYSSRTETALSKLKDTAGNYLTPPSALPARVATTQIPNNITAGTSSDTSEVYVGQWSHLVLGVRTALRIRVLEERFAEFGQVALMADLRGDVVVTQPSAFNIITGVR